MEKEILKKLNALIKYRSVSYSSEQTRLKLDIQKQYGGTIINENLIINKGNPKIAIVAHLDINQIKGTPKVEYKNGFIYSTNKVGCGFDDKAGICFALMYLEKNNNIQIIFTHDEEVGCIGAKKVVLDKNIKFLLQLDRRGNSDISQYTNGINTVNEDLKETLLPTLINYGYNWKNCIYTDIGEIAKNNSVQAVNISCGYYNEHTEHEYLNIKEFINACNFATDLINELNRIDIKPLERTKSYDWHEWIDEPLQDNEDYYLYELIDSLTLTEISKLKQLLKYY